MMSDWNVELIDDSVSDFEVIFKGPKESKPSNACICVCHTEVSKLYSGILVVYFKSDQINAILFKCL